MIKQGINTTPIIIVKADKVYLLFVVFVAFYIFNAVDSNQGFHSYNFARLSHIFF